LTHRAWLQAGLATASGGLGLRHAALHGAAAYAALVAATADLCLALDANSIPPLDDALRAVNAVVSAADSFPVPPPPNLRQQQLSQAVDRAVVTQLMLPAQVLKAIGLTFSSRRPLGAGAWLHAPPCEALGLHLASPLFKVLVRMRLRLALSDKDIACPLRDGIADRFGDHVAVTARNGTTASVLCLRLGRRRLARALKLKKVGFSHLAPKSMRRCLGAFLGVARPCSF